MNNYNYRRKMWFLKKCLLRNKWRRLHISPYLKQLKSLTDVSYQAHVSDSIRRTETSYECGKGLGEDLKRIWIQPYLMSGKQWWIFETSASRSGPPSQSSLNTESRMLTEDSKLSSESNSRILLLCTWERIHTHPDRDCTPLIGGVIWGN